MNVLLVEDDAELRGLYAEALLADGIEVTAANTAQAALDALEESRPDIVILDIMLPVHNGLTIMYEMQSYDDWSRIPIIVLSAIPKADIFVNDDLIERLNIAEYLDKSLTAPTELPIIIKRVLGK